MGFAALGRGHHEREYVAAMDGMAGLFDTVTIQANMPRQHIDLRCFTRFVEAQIPEQFVDA